MATAQGKRYSKYHPQRSCSVCTLCGKSCSYYSHYGGWTDEEKNFLKQHWGTEPESSSCICVAHQKEAKRAHPPEYTPKWSKKTPPSQVQDRDVCMYPSCTINNKLITPSFAPISELRAVLQVHNEEKLLCHKHYQELYRQFTTSQPCASCGIKPKPGMCFTRHSPNADLINEVLHRNSVLEEAEMLTPNDYICLNCYKTHLAVIESHEDTNYLKDMIKIWKSALCDDANDKLTKATLHSVLYVADEFENQRAVLLPHVSRLFLREYLGTSDTDSESQEQILESREGTLKFTSRWLLKQLKVYLHSHMEYKCVHKKFGTLLFRKGGDLLTSLSWALGTGNFETKFKDEDCIKPIPSLNCGKVLGEAGDIMNDLLHSEITRHSQTDLKNMDQLNIDEEIDNIDPLLWLFLESITRTVKQRQSACVEETTQIKKLRRYYIFCLLCFCANTQRPTVLHTLLADTVEVCGGSRKLMKIFNQLGAISSPDTHDRFITDMTIIQRAKTLWDDLPNDTLTIASVDNFDMLQSHAAVYCGDQSRSYHGTTVQIMQPNPAIRMHENETSHTTKKRSIGCSPASSPHKLGKVGPKRPRTLTPRNLTQQLQSAVVMCNQSDATTVSLHVTQHVTTQGFLEQPGEKLERESLESKMLAYAFLKFSLSDSNGASNRVLLEFKDLYAYATQGSVIPSNIYYMELVDENPDSSDTMRHVSELLLSTANSEHQHGFVVLIGDGKTYQHLIGIKKMYGELLSKLVIFPGDWHTLANFQPVLMKIYYHAGLKELAQASGFKGETLTSLERCSNFKRTHQFLLQVWQAMYRALIAAFSSTSNTPNLPDVTLDEDITIRDLLRSTEQLLKGSGADQEFNKYLSAMSDDTCKFWKRFVFEDCFSYIQLYLAIRCQNWQLRLSALKLMAPLFVAYDRTTYQRLIPYHLADIQKFPPHIMENLKKGFTISINGGKGHAVAIDEAHEMCINKDMKMAITYPTKAYLQKTSLFLRYRIATHKNLLRQIFPSLKGAAVLFDIFSNTPEIKKKEENITVMLNEIHTKALFPTSATPNRGLVNIFSGIKATPEQSFDLMNFRDIGSNNLKNFINYYILKIPSTDAPVRKKKLLTMAAPKTVSKRLMNQKEKEMKQVTKCLRQRLAWCNRTGESYDPTREQYSLYPRAIADEYGCPLKGSKSIWKDKLKKRYPGPNTKVVLDMLPQQWKPDAVIIDGMFLINCKPLRSTATIRDYSNFLFKRFLLPHYHAQVNEVHLLFDIPRSGNIFNPKLFEQNRRDKGKDKGVSHQHVTFTPSSKIPTGWRPYIDCRQCKRSIIEAIGLSYMQSVRLHLRPGQTLYLSGCFPVTGNTSTFKMSGNESLPSPALRYISNSDEADMRIWRHVTQTGARRVLVYSPDTDVYNIGLPILPNIPDKDVIIQLNVPHSQTCLYLHLNNLLKALEFDPDLANLPRPELAGIFQMLFITSGCDYISYFAGQGKAAFFNAFFQHAAFITGQQLSGLLSDFTEDKKETGFLAFLRLIGTLYFKKHYSAIVSLKGVETPQQLLHAQGSSQSSPQEMHLLWYNSIRAIVGERIACEEERMPSHTSMWRHWLRSCWVASMWHNSSEEDLQGSLPPPETCGWKKNSDGSYGFDWECPDIQQNVQDTINFLTKGCSCKGGCLSQRCGCMKKGHHCGPGCQCQNCQNVVPITEKTAEQAISENEDSDIDTEEEEGTEVDDTEASSSELETEIISDIYEEQNDFSIDF